MAKKKYRYYAWLDAAGKSNILRTWSECELESSGRSGEQHKGFNNIEAAEAFIAEGLLGGRMITYDSIKKFIDCSNTSEVLLNDDLPKEINEGVLEYFEVNSLDELSDENVKRLRNAGNLYSFYKSNEGVDYNLAAVDYYTIVYLPVNFYKIWLPLYELVSKQTLPSRIKVLEVGAGPGTSTWSLICFYKALAKENPTVKFCIEYDFVELNSNFDSIFHKLKSKCLLNLPENLEVTFNKELYGINAFDYLDGLNRADYDIILESNLLNNFEKHCDYNKYVNGIKNGLKLGGYAIFIEPGTNDLMLSLNCLQKNLSNNANCVDFIKPLKSQIKVSGLSLYQASIKNNIRTCGKETHWFDCLVVKKK